MSGIKWAWNPANKTVLLYAYSTKEVLAHVTGRELKVLVAMIYNFAFTEGTLPVRPYVAYFGLIVFPASINLYPPIVIAFREKHFLVVRKFHPNFVCLLKLPIFPVGFPLLDQIHYMLRFISITPGAQ
mgnify:CR=1 FL=1